MVYYLTIALQGYCLYHMYKHGAPYYWIFIIVFIPVVGSIIYLITQVFNKRDAEKIQDGIVSIVNPTKKITELEKKLRFSDTYQNQINLAEAYLENKDYQAAIAQYETAIKDKAQNNFYALTKLIEACFFTEDYNKVVNYSKEIEHHPEFKKSRTQFILGLAQEKLGNIEKAEINLRQINIRYSFYEERLALSKFLINHNKTADAKAILEEIVLESENMTKPNKKRYRATIRETIKVLNDIS
ncbi:MAG: hypothetical protein ACK5NB_04960 [Flavobacteriaceae bacterium]